MSKELKALEKICSKGCDYCDTWHYEHNLHCKHELGGCSKCVFCGEEHDIIETALKDYEDLKERMGITDVVMEDFIKLWKEHKALEIIKEKNVNIYKLKICDNLEEYNKLSNTGYPLTQEEFELLKEELI